MCLIVELHDFGGDIHVRSRPQHRRLRVADVQHHRKAILRGVLFDHRHHLIPEVLHELLVLFVQVGLGILGFALQAGIAGIDVAHQLGTGFLAHRGLLLL